MAKLKIALLYDIWNEDPIAAAAKERDKDKEEERPRPKVRRKKSTKTKRVEKTDREEIFEALQKLGHEPSFFELDGRPASLHSLSRCDADLRSARRPSASKRPTAKRSSKRCRNSGTSLPFLSWMAVRPRCIRFPGATPTSFSTSSSLLMAMIPRRCTSLPTWTCWVCATPARVPTRFSCRRIKRLRKRFSRFMESKRHSSQLATAGAWITLTTFHFL